VLTIGLLVDDAIVVVENVERIITEEGLLPREATRKAMGQITGALIGVALVLSAVFVPMAFFSGSVGAIYWFNRGFESGRDKYVHGVRHVIARFGRWLAIYAAMIVAVGLLFVRLPTSFLPDED
jgi:multidrug efflux pump